MKRYKVGQRVRVRFGQNWIVGVVLDVFHNGITVDAGGPIHIHQSVFARDVRKAAL